MLEVQQAVEMVLARARELESERRALGEALGYALAEDIPSDIDSPPWDKALMDGYAVQAEDVAASGASLAVIEEVTAGAMPTKEVVPGTATRIMTGAPLPRGADAVVMVERTELQGSQVRVNSGVTCGQNILRQGASMRREEVVLGAGQIVRPIEAGILAEVGREEVWVTRRPRVSIVSTGNELVDVGQTPSGGQIRNSNGPLLAALVRSAGGEAVELGIARDQREDLRAKMIAGLQADVLVLSGGVSAGVLDLVPRTLEELGVEQVFHKVNLKPGKPVWFGAYRPAEKEIGKLTHPARRGGEKLVFGLPGNPVSTLVCFGLFVRPALLALAGKREQIGARRAALAKEHHQRDERPTYFPAVFAVEDGRDTVTPLVWRGSADLRALAGANCLAFFPGGEKVYPAGTVIETYPV